MRKFSTGRGIKAGHGRGRLSRPNLARALVEALEPRTLLSGFVPADLAGTWNLLGTQQLGSIIFDDAGNVTGGSILQADGSTDTPDGAFGISSEGVLSFGGGGSANAGAMNSAKDLMVVTNSGEGSLSVLSSPGAASFSLSDLSGTWNFAINGTDFTDNVADTNGFGTLIFDGAGSITGGAVTTGAGTSPITGGTYTLNDDGQYDLQFNVDNGGEIDPTEVIGSLNASKDVLALDPPADQFPDAVTNGEGTLATAIREGSGLADTNAAGTWLIFGAGDSGYVILDSAGHVTSGGISTNGGENSLAGTYTVSSNGTLKLNLSASGADGNQSFNAQGGINSTGSVFTVNDTGNENNMVVGIKVSSTADRIPTLTTVAPFSGAVDGVPYDITYSDLLAASNAADKDGDTLQFQVTSLGPGSWSLDGNPINQNGDDTTSIPFTISSGDTLEWVPDQGTQGAVPALQVKAYDGIVASASPVAVVVQTALSGPNTFDNDQIEDTWTLASDTADGTIAFDDSGNVDNVDGDTNITTNTGQTLQPGGNYTLNSDGSLALTTDAFSGTGAMSTTHDLIAISNPANDPALDLLVRHGDDTFSDGDLVGTWTVEFNGQDSGSTGGGTFVFDGQGNIIGGTIKSGVKTFTPTGNYTVSPDGSVEIDVSSNEPDSQIQLLGSLDASKDVLILNPSNLEGATNTQDSTLFVLVHGSGNYSDADLAGNWSLSTENGIGTITLDGAGHITAGSGTAGDGAFTVGGTYAVSSSGQITLKLTLNENGQTKSQTITGAMNASRNAIIFTQAGTKNNDSLAVLLRTGNHAPTLTAIAPFATAVAGQPFDGITYGALSASAHDIDGDTLDLQITSIAPTKAGTLTINGDAATVGGQIAPGDTVVWTPAANTSGKIAAFSVEAFDGSLTSATPEPVFVNTVLPVTVNISANKNKASEINGNTTGAGQFTITRTNGIPDQSLTVFYSVGGTATDGVDYPVLPGSITLNPGQTTTTITINPANDGIAEPTETVILSLSPSDDYGVGAKGSGTVSIADDSPTVSLTATRSKASEINNGSSTGTGLFTFTRAGGDLSQALVVDYSIGGTATTNGSDYNQLSGSITIQPNQKTATLTIVPTSIVLMSPNQTVTLQVIPDAGPSYHTSSKDTATVTITDVNYPPAAIAGDTASVTITSGVAPFANKGAFQLAFNAANGQYLLIGGNGVSSSDGTFQYSRVSSTTATVVFTDATLGQIDGTITYSSATAATITLDQVSSGAIQTGKITFAGPPKTPFAPASQVQLSGSGGRTANVKITAGTTLPSTGSFQLILAGSSNNYAIAGTPATTSSFGTYSYSQFGPDIGVITVSDSANGDGMMILQFSSATKAAFTSQFMDGAQRGSFTLNAATTKSFVPPGFTNNTLNVTISKASSPFALSGSFTQSFATGNYQTSGAMNSTGTFSSVNLTPTIALLTLTDSAGGPEHELVTFTSASNASVLLFNDTTGGFLTGSASVVVAGTAPAVELLLTISASAPTTISPDASQDQAFTPFTGGTWQVYAQLVGDLSSTLGFGGLTMNVTGASGATVYDYDDGDGSIGTTLDLPATPQLLSNDQSFPAGFNLAASTGQDGQQISAYQNNTSYKVSPGAAPNYTSVIEGVGIAPGSAGSNSWGSPALVASGYYEGSAGTLTVDANVENITTLPASLPTPTTGGVGYPAGTIAGVDGAIGQAADGTDTVTISAPL